MVLNGIFAALGILTVSTAVGVWLAGQTLGDRARRVVRRYAAWPASVGPTSSSCGGRSPSAQRTWGA